MLRSVCLLYSDYITDMLEFRICLSLFASIFQLLVSVEFVQNAPRSQGANRMHRFASMLSTAPELDQEQRRKELLSRQRDAREDVWERSNICYVEH